MKIRSFTVGLLDSVMLSASLMSCAIPPASPTIMSPATQTPTLVIPSQTPLPTESPSPESLLPKKYTQVEINQMTNEEKLVATPNEITQTVEDEIDGGSSEVVLTQSNVSSVKPELVVYRDGKGNIQSVYNLLTGESQTIAEAGIIELDTVDGSKLEVLAFIDERETMDHVGKDAMWFNGDRAQNKIDYPEVRNVVKEMFKIRDNIIGVIPKNGNGIFPPYPEDENIDYIKLFLYDVGDNGVVLLYIDKNGNPGVAYFDKKDISNDRNHLFIFIFDEWKPSNSN